MELSYRVLTAVAAAVLFGCAGRACRSGFAPCAEPCQRAERVRQYTIPAAWGGVWSFQDSDYDCKTNVLIETFPAETDTLCSGQVIYDDPKFQCTGSVSDTHIDIQCSATFPIDEDAAQRLRLVWTGRERETRPTSPPSTPRSLRLPCVRSFPTVARALKPS